MHVGWRVDLGDLKAPVVKATTERIRLGGEGWR